MTARFRATSSSVFLANTSAFIGRSRSHIAASVTESM